MQNNTLPEIQILIGLPGSGKSTYVRQLEYKSQIKYSIISTDDVVEIFGFMMNRKYSQIWKDLIDSVTKIVKIQFRLALEDKSNILYDQTNLTAEKRKSILTKVPAGYRKIAVVFNPPFDVIKERLVTRAQNTGKVISLNIVEDMQKRFEYPTLEEGFDEIRVDGHVSEQRDATNSTGDNPKSIS